MTNQCRLLVLVTVTNQCRLFVLVTVTNKCRLSGLVTVTNKCRLSGLVTGAIGGEVFAAQATGISYFAACVVFETRFDWVVSKDEV